MKLRVKEMEAEAAKVRSSFSWGCRPSNLVWGLLPSFIN